MSLSIYNLKFSNRKSRSYGFTLIELMVTIGIFMFMTYLIIARYNNYYSGTIFKNLAYDIAITIRQAQSYGISVKIDEEVGVFDRAYGVQFPGQGTQFNLKSYTKNNNNYNENKLEKGYNLKNGATISQIKVSTNGVDFIDASSLVIIFQRPNPEAIICGTINNASDCSTYRYGKLILLAPNGNTLAVNVNSSGQVSITE